VGEAGTAVAVDVGVAVGRETASANAAKAARAAGSTGGPYGSSPTTGVGDASSVTSAGKTPPPGALSVASSAAAAVDDTAYDQAPAQSMSAARRVGPPCASASARRRTSGRGSGIGRPFGAARLP